MDKRERLIEAAIKLFAAEGINATSTGSIAKEAGVAAGTLFNYFATKEELIKAAYVECKQGMHCSLQDEMQEGVDFETLIRESWSSAIEWSLANPGRHDFMHQFARMPDWHDAELEERLSGEMNVFHSALRNAQERGEVVDLDVEYLQQMFASWYDGTVRYLRTLDEGVRPHFVEESLEMLWRAMSTGKSAAGKDATGMAAATGAE